MSIEKLVMNPALDARNSIAPIRKTIKKRENKRLDVEKCQDKVHKLHRKMPRSPKDEAQLSKSEDELVTLNEVWWYYLCQGMDRYRVLTRVFSGVRHCRCALARDPPADHHRCLQPYPTSFGHTYSNSKRAPWSVLYCFTWVLRGKWLPISISSHGPGYCLLV